MDEGYKRMLQEHKDLIEDHLEATRMFDTHTQEEIKHLQIFIASLEAMSKIVDSLKVSLERAQ